MTPKGHFEINWPLEGDNFLNSSVLSFSSFVIGSTDQLEYFLGVEVRVIEGLLDIIWPGFWISDFRFLNWIANCSLKIDLTTQVLLCKKL